MSDTTTTENLRVVNWNALQRATFARAPQLYKPGFAGLDQEHIDLLHKEKGGVFVRVPGQEIPHIKEREEREAVGTGKKPCPMCGHGKEGPWEVHLLHKGEITGMQVMWPVRCRCFMYRKYFSRWSDTRNVHRIHRDCTYRGLMLGELRDRFALNDEAYATMIAALRKYRFYNTLLVGPGGCGKSTLMTALYEGALQVWAQRSWEAGLCDPGVWKVRALQLADEQHAWAMKGEYKDGDPIVPIPTVTPELVDVALLPRNQFNPHLSIEEFDKYKISSEFQNRLFHAVIDKVAENDGQVICNSNIDIEYLRERFGPQFAWPVIRRLVGGPRGMYINFWYGTVYVNRVRQRLNKQGELVDDPTDVIDESFTGKPMSGGKLQVGTPAGAGGDGGGGGGQDKAKDSRPAQTTTQRPPTQARASAPATKSSTTPPPEQETDEDEGWKRSVSDRPRLTGKIRSTKHL